MLVILMILSVKTKRANRYRSRIVSKEDVLIEKKIDSGTFNLSPPNLCAGRVNKNYGNDELN